MGAFSLRTLLGGAIYMDKKLNFHYSRLNTVQV